MRSAPSRQKAALWGIAAVVILGVLLISVYAVGRRMEESKYHEERGVASEGFGQLARLEYDGKTYIQRSGLTTVLLMGVDKKEGEQLRGFRQGGQADFLLLLVIDDGRKVIHQLQIDRDTMTDVITLGVLGNELGTRNMQICLSHGFGQTERACCKHTIAAVENLLPGIDIDLYMAMDLNAIGVLNDALGGVTVTLGDDFTAYDPEMAKGKEMTLNGDQAELFVRYRLGVGDGTNESRMKRQRAYMSAASDVLVDRLRQDTGFIGTLYDALDGVITTNITRNRVLNEANRAYKYDVRPVETLSGEYRIGEDGFMEFHADEDAAFAWVVETCYQPKN
jgi:LCP family protein required for cell wall assembly